MINWFSSTAGRMRAAGATVACAVIGVSMLGAPAAAAPAAAAGGSLPAFVTNGRDDAASAFDILAPGEYGSVPTTASSTDQGTLYDALTPLRGNVTSADLSRDYLSERLGVQGPVAR